jgi:hypothetical protein
VGVSHCKAGPNKKKKKKKTTRPYPRIIKAIKGWSVAQVVELPNQCEALNLNFSSTKKKKKLECS